MKTKLKIVRKISNGIDYIVLIASILLFIIGGYAIIDTYEVHQEAGASSYAMYKPKDNDNLSYKKLKEINNETIGWIDIFGTKIDYPLLQTEDNHKYLNTTPIKEYSTAGSIFLDYRNNGNLSDFKNIIYGHYMAERKMFGDLSLFFDKKFFDTHKYGTIKRDNNSPKNIEFFAAIRTTGTDRHIFNAESNDNASKQKILDYVNQKAEQKRPVNIGYNDNLVFLTTCDVNITNGRYILVGKLTDQIHKDKFKEDKTEAFRIDFKNIETKLIQRVIFTLWIILIIIYVLYEKIRKNKIRKLHDEQNKNK